ncbi:hypothetical protein C8F04DRAFT_1103632 [Mycena alexandri]|uniref:Uncharacterized protein n=1 Tax=Mycena alexandri TaxID=1745969 RepID=A0AAD6SKV3_9AGAR|nr:hypothetical protein C8F04DRAFT_1117139 [Mycena alexandri]KAJ7033626.1 hypothetical protein C8F04DRAFT_1103632 [Mycena alexandri]
MSTGSSSSSFSPLSDADAQILHLYGRNTLQDAFGVIWETMLIGAYGVIFGVAVYSIFRKGLKSRGSIALLCAIVSLYASSLTLWALVVTQWIDDTHIAFMSNPNISLPDRKGLVNDNMLRFGPQRNALYVFNMVVTDGVVLWRAWVLYPRALWIVSIPCILLVLTFTLGVVNVLCIYAIDIHQLPNLSSSSRVCEPNLPWTFSLVTNITCTILIAYRAWQHRRTMKTLGIVGHSRGMSADKVLSILVESGLIYCLLWLTQIYNYLHFGPGSRPNAGIYIFYFFNGIGNHIPGIYSTLIIVLVNFKQTIWETNTVSTIQFAGQHKSGRSNVHPDSGVEAESSGELNITVHIETPLSHHE